jgi:hypothetical protein
MNCATSRSKWFFQFCPRTKFYPRSENGIPFQLLLKLAPGHCFQIAAIAAPVIGLRCARVCWKPEKVTYDNGFQNFLNSNCEDGQISQLLQPLHPVHNRISSSHRQLSEIITPESLVGLRCMGSRQKAEKVSWDVAIEGFLRWYLNWVQNRRFLIMLKSAHNRILAARFNFQNPQLLNRWSYQGMKITVRRVRKSSITLVISVWSDCSHIGSRIAVSDCGLQ